MHLNEVSYTNNESRVMIIQSSVLARNMTTTQQLFT